MRLFVTGMEGFAGSHLVRFLVDQGHTVGGTVFDRTMLGNLEPTLSELEIFECDLREKERVLSVISGFSPEGIFHLAAQAFVPRSFQNPQDTYHTNIMGGTNLLDAVRRSRIPARVLVVSTAEVYGTIRPDELPVDEDTPIRPANPYSVSKRCLEEITMAYVRDFGIQAVIVRPFNHTGPRQSPDFVCSDFSRQVAMIEKGMKEPVMSVGNLFPTRDFTDVRDVVRAYYRALIEGVVGEVYNICSAKGETIRRILETLVAYSGRDIRIHEQAGRKRATDIPEIIGDFSRFQRLTGWKPAIPLEQTLRDMLETWRRRLDGTGEDN